MPSIAAPAARTRAALSVQTSGRKPPSASANDCTLPVGSADARELRREGRAARAERDDDVAGLQPEAQGGAHVVAGARGHAPARMPCPADDLGRRRDARHRQVGAGGAAGAGRGGTRGCRPTSSRCRRRHRRRWSSASGAVAPSARIRPVSQSWGSTQVRARARLSGSWSAIQRSLLTVVAATGTRPVGVGPGLRRRARRPGRRRPAPSGCRSTAARRRTTSPCSSSSTMPCCWPPTATRGDAVEDAVAARLPPGRPTSGAGSTSVPSGCEAPARCARPPRSRRRRRRPCTTGSRCRPRRRADGQAWQSLSQEFLWARPAVREVGAGSSARELGRLPGRPEAVGRVDAGPRARSTPARAAAARARGVVRSGAARPRGDPPVGGRVRAAAGGRAGPRRRGPWSAGRRWR